MEVYEGFRTSACNQILGHIADQNYVAFID